MGVNVRLLDWSGEDLAPGGAKDSLGETFEGFAQGLNALVVADGEGER